MNKRYSQLLFALLIFAVANTADYLLQAYQHGWPAFFALSADAPKWGIFDFIPHDSWHIAQWSRNICMILGSVFGAAAGGGFVAYHRLPYNWIWMLSAILPYVITRGIFFSALRLISIGY
jgi:hypothetical protein